jgi:hypothetical protein
MMIYNAQGHESDSNCVLTKIQIAAAAEATVPRITTTSSSDYDLQC